MTDTPRTKQLKEVRLKRLAFLEKTVEASDGEPVSKNGIKSSRKEKPVHKSIVDERFENSGSTNAAGKSSLFRPRPDKDSGNLEGTSFLGKSSLVSGRRSDDFKSSNESGINKSENNLQRTGLVEKCAKKTPRGVKVTDSGGKSTKDSPANELKWLNDTSSRRSLAENDVEGIQNFRLSGSVTTLTDQTVGSEPVRKSISNSETEEDKRKSSDVSQDRSADALNAGQRGTSWHLNADSISDSVSSKLSTKQGFETYRVSKKDLRGVAQESDLVALTLVKSHRSTVQPRPSASQSKCFGPSEVKTKAADVAALSTNDNFEDDKKQQTDCLGYKDASGRAGNCSSSLKNGMLLQSVGLEGDDFQRLFTSSASNQDLKTGNSFGKTSSVRYSVDNGTLDESLAQSRSLSKSSIKSSVLIHVDEKGNSRDKGLYRDPRQSNTFSASASSSSSSSIMKSVASHNHVDDAVKEDEMMMKHLPNSGLPSSGIQVQKAASLSLPPSDSVEYSVPDFVKDVAQVNAVARSQVPNSESNDFLSSVYAEQNSEVPASETLVSTIASTLNFGSVNLELVLGKDRMERLLKNIMEIDGSADFSLKESTITDLSVSDSHEVRRKLTDKPQVIRDSSTFEGRDSHDTEKLDCGFNSARVSSDSLGLKTHRPGDSGDHSRALLTSSSSSSIRSKKDKMKCSFLVDEIYAEAQMLKDGQGCRSRSDIAMVTVPDALREVRNKPVEAFVMDQNASDLRRTHPKFPSEDIKKPNESTLKAAEMPSNPEKCFTGLSLQIEPRDFIDSTEKKKHRRKETRKQDALANSREEHIKGIRLKMQQQWNKEHVRPDGVVDNNSEQVTCYMNPAIDRYFKSLENLTFERESVLPKAPQENSLQENELEFSVVGRSLKKEDADTIADGGDGFQQKLSNMKTDLFEAIDRNSDTLFNKVTSVVGVIEKDAVIQSEVFGTDHNSLESAPLEDESQCLGVGKRSKFLGSLPESRMGSHVPNVSGQDPLLSNLKKVEVEEKLLNRSHDDDATDCNKVQSSNAVGSSCTTTSVWKMDRSSDEKITGKSQASSSSLKEMEKKPVFAPILNVRDSEEFEYSDLGRRGMGSFGEFFKDEMSINLRDSDDVSRSRNSALRQQQLKSIVEDCTMDSVNFDYITQNNKLNFSEELKATLRLDLSDSIDVEEQQRRMGKKEAVDVNAGKEDKSRLKKSANSGLLSKSLSKSQERQSPDAAGSVSRKLKLEQSAPAAKSSKSPHSATEDASSKNDDVYQEFARRLVNDTRFKKTGLESKSSESISAQHVPKLQLSHSMAKPSKTSSSKARPFASVSSSVLGKTRVAWKDDGLVMDVSASVQCAPLSRQRPWSAKVLPRSSFPDESGFVLDQSSRSGGEALSVRKKRPSSVGPRSRRKVVSGDADLNQLIEELHRSPFGQSVQVSKAKGQSKQIFRFASEDYEKYLALSPRIQTGELSMLTSFPDEILLKIFSYLSQSNLSHCARVCEHFFRVAMDNSLWRRIELEERAMTDEYLAAIGRKRPSSLVLFQCTGDKVTSNGLRQLFWECSESLRELRFSGCSKGHLTGENILLHATNRCRNITHVDGSWTNLSSQGIIAFSEESERLVSICLSGCKSISDEAVQSLVRRHGERLLTLELLGLFGLTNVAVETIGSCCKNLVTLTLGQCWKLTDSCIAQLSTNMPRLENLDLRGCKQIKDQTIHQLVKNCGQLTSLILANCPNLTDSSLAEIAVQCPRLRSLDVCGCSKLTNVGLKTLVSGCSVLMYLDLSSTSINHRSVTAIASYCSRRLEVLKINFCKQMNQESLIRLVKNCKRLKKLYMYGVKGLHSIHELKTTNPNIWIEM